MKYHEVEITEDMIRRAESNTKTHGNNGWTIDESEESRFAGYLGEEMAEKFLSGLTRENCKDYDFVRWKGQTGSHTIDVKTKRRGKRIYPRDNYSVHINESGSHQQCDTYVFAQVNLTDTGWRGWIIGWMDKKEYWDTARVVKKGEVEEDDKWPEHSDCRKLYFRDLNHY